MWNSQLETLVVLYSNNWMHGTNQLVFERSQLPHELFELFLTNEEIERTCVKSTNYAHLKGNHMFIVTVEKLKAFLMILLASGCAGLPIQEMSWERREDRHNLAVLAMMTKTKFLESKQYLHLADNNTIVQMNLLTYNHYF